MSETTIRFKLKYPQFKAVNDDLLAYYIGSQAPVYLNNDETLIAEYQRGALRFQQQAEEDAAKAEQEKIDDRGWIQTIGDAWQRGVAGGEKAKVHERAKRTGWNEENAEEIASLTKVEQSNPPSKLMREINEAESFTEIATMLATPRAIPLLAELATENIPKFFVAGFEKIGQSVGIGAAAGAAGGAPFAGIGAVPGALIGAKAGFIAGTGFSSYMIESSAKYYELMAEQGYDPSDAGSILEFAHSQKIYKDALAKARDKALPIMFVDMLSAGVAGKFVGKPITAAGLSALQKAKKKAADLGVEYAMQAGLAGTGEFASQWYSGEEIQRGAIALEMLGEFAGSGTTEIAVGAADTALTQATSQKGPPAAPADIFMLDQLPTIPGANKPAPFPGVKVIEQETINDPSRVRVEGDTENAIQEARQIITDSMESGGAAFLETGEGKFETLNINTDGNLVEAGTGRKWSPLGLANYLADNPSARLSIVPPDERLQGEQALTAKERTNYIGGGDLVNTPEGVGVVSGSPTGVATPVRLLANNQVKWFATGRVVDWGGRSPSELTEAQASQVAEDRTEMGVTEGLGTVPIAARPKSKKKTVGPTAPADVVMEAEMLGVTGDIMTVKGEKAQRRIIENAKNQRLEERIIDDWKLDGMQLGMTRDEVNAAYEKAGLLELRRQVEQKRAQQKRQDVERQTDAWNIAMGEAVAAGVPGVNINKAKSPAELESMAEGERLKGFRLQEARRLVEETKRQRKAEVQAEVDAINKAINEAKEVGVPESLIYSRRGAGELAALIEQQKAFNELREASAKQAAEDNSMLIEAAQALTTEENPEVVINNLNQELGLESKAARLGIEDVFNKARNIPEREMLLERASAISALTDARRERFKNRLSKLRSQAKRKQAIEEELPKLAKESREARRVLPEAMQGDPYAMGILPGNPFAGSKFIDAMRQLTKSFMAKSTAANVHTDEPFVFDDKHGILPRPMPWNDLKKIASQAAMAGRIPVLGRLIDPRYSNWSLPDQSISTYMFVAEGMAKAVGGAVRSFMKNSFDQFSVDDVGQIRNIAVNPSEPNVPDSMFYQDVIEQYQRNKNSYIFANQKQQDQLDEVIAFVGEVGKLLKEYGLEPRVMLDAYFPHIVIGHRNPVSEARGTGGRSIGETPAMFLERKHKTVAEGVANGEIYAPTVADSLGMFVERAYKAIADKMLIEDKDLKPTKRNDWINKYIAANNHLIARGLTTPQALKERAAAEASRRSIKQPGFANLVFDDPEVAKALTKAFPLSSDSILKHVADFNGFSKAIVLGFDLGVMFNQGLVLMYNRPDIWLKAFFRSILNMNEDNYNQWLGNTLNRPDNQQAVVQMVQMGMTAGQLPEMLEGLRSRYLREAPLGISTAARAFERQLITFFDVSKIELWKAWRDVTPPSQRFEVAQSIEAMIGLGRMESIGVGHRQAAYERALFLAPSYYRGTANFLVSFFQPGISGKIARRALTRYAVGSVFLYVATALELGMDKDDIEKRLNPANSGFMTWDIKTNDPKRPEIQVGIGNVYRSVLRTMADIIEKSVNNPGQLKSLDPQLNPAVKWFRGHSSPTIGTAYSLFYGADYLGETFDITDIPRETGAPLWASEAMDGATPEEIALSFIGVQSWPKGVQARYGDEREQVAKETYGKKFKDLSLPTQLRISAVMNRKPPFDTELNQPKTLRQQKVAMEMAEERKQSLMKMLSKDNRKWAEDNGYTVPGYQRVWVMHGVPYYLSDEQDKTYRKHLANQYDRYMNIWRENGAFDGWPLAKVNTTISKAMTLAKRAARAMTISESFPRWSPKEDVPLSISEE